MEELLEVVLKENLIDDPSVPERDRKGDLEGRWPFDQFVGKPFEADGHVMK